MPILEFVCKDCSKIFEVKTTLKDFDNLVLKKIIPKCDKCESKNTEQVTSVANNFINNLNIKYVIQRVAFDVHGTLDCDDGTLMTILDSCIKNKDEVFIISGPPAGQVTEEISALGINPASVTTISVVDWLKNNDVHMWQDIEGTWWCDDAIWWQSKGKICKEYKIDIMFDDCHGYHVSMPETTEFIHWK